MISKLEDDFQIKIDTLNSLYKQRDNLSASIKELRAIYKIDSSFFTPEIWLNLINFSDYAHNDDSRVGILELRAKLRDEHNIEAQKLYEINQEIFINNIDITIDKIKLLQKRLDKKDIDD